MKRDAPATHRNREPILEVLARWLTQPARVLEIASGTGQHVAFFATRLSHLVWQPSDRVEEGARAEGMPPELASIDAWRKEAACDNLLPPIALDAASPEWPVEPGSFDVLFNANMIHIAPWSVAVGLMAGAGRALESGGLLFLYGPFKVDGQQTSESNEAFDQSLRSRDPAWGIRELADVKVLAEKAGLDWVETNEMPANNKLLVFRRK